MTSKVCIVFSTAVVMLCSAVSQGVPIAALDYSALEKNSDLICVCKVQAVKCVGTVNKSFSFVDGIVECKEFEASCRVLATLKGMTQEEFKVRFLQGRDSFLGFCSVSKGEQAILFLKRNADIDGYAFSDLQNSKIPILKYYPRSDSAAFSVRKRIESQLLAALESKKSDEIINGAFWLKQLKSAEGRKAVMRLAEGKSAPAPVRAFALEVKIPDGKSEVIEEALALLEETLEYKGKAKWRFDVVWAFSKIKGTSEVQRLNRLLLEGPLEVARALSFSSREWANKTSIPYLVWALQRLDREGKYRCILALYKLTGRPTPSHEEFMANPSKYILDWQQWWGAGESAHLRVPAGVESARRKEAFWAWPAFLFGAVAGISVFGMVLLLGKKVRRCTK